MVYKAINMKTGEIVAIKEMKKTARIADGALQGFSQEVQLLTRLRHPNVVKVIDSITQNDTLSLIMEFVDGGSLASIITKCGKFPESLTALYMSQVLEGLAYLHENNVIHRDVKGGNILVTKEGVAKLVDFGCAAAICSDMTKRVTVVGTPYWMAPEVVSMTGQGPQSDIWSFAATIIELVTSQPPYWGMPPVSAMFHIVQDGCVELPNDISPELRDLLRRCFVKNPEDRPSAAALKTHPWFPQINSSNSGVSGVSMIRPDNPRTLLARTMTFRDLQENVKDFNSSRTKLTPSCLDESDTTNDLTSEKRLPSLSSMSPHICSSSEEGSERIPGSTEGQIKDLVDKVEKLKLKVKKEKHRRKKLEEEKDDLKERLDLLQREFNTPERNLADFFNLLCMATKMTLNNEGKKCTFDPEQLRQRAVKEGIPWNRWVEWVPQIIKKHYTSKR